MSPGRILDEVLRDAPQAPAPPPGPAVEVADGPVVAVCGLAGGAGTTTLAWLLAIAATRQGRAPALLCETPSSAGGIAHVTGVSGPGSLGQHLKAVASGGACDAPVHAPGGPQVLASRPQLAPPVPADQLPGAVAHVLAEFQADYGLVVIDCGRLHAPDARAAVAAATHVVWTLPAGRHAGELATALLDGELGPPQTDAVEVLALSATRPVAVAPFGQRPLRRLAAERLDRLVFVPYAKSLAAGRLDEVPRRLHGPLAAISGVLSWSAAS